VGGSGGVSWLHFRARKPEFRTQATVVTPGEEKGGTGIDHQYAVHTG
jgi:hypothetical protein